MIWRILPHTSMCIAADALILLDIRQDRYFRVPRAVAPSMKAWLEDVPAPPPPVIQQMLVENGIARDRDPTPVNTARESVRIPTELVSPIWCTTIAPAGLRGVVLAQIATSIKLRTRSLETTLLDHVRATAARPPIDSVHLQSRCAAFERARPFSPFPRNCLLDTLSLDRWLGEDARDCRIVFGVTAHPFMAHCWLQSRHAVLNDSYDHVTRHTPILAI